MSDRDTENPRREFLRKSLTLIPVVTVASTGIGMNAFAGTPAAAAALHKYHDIPAAGNFQPSFFTAEEWAFVQAAVSRLIPADDLGAGAPGRWKLVRRSSLIVR